MGIASGQVVLAAEPLAETLHFFTNELEFSLEEIWPADSPRVAIVHGHGMRLRLDGGAGPDSSELVLMVEDGPIDTPELLAPNGTTIRFEPAEPSVDVPAGTQALVHSRADDTGAAGWQVGRAGMRYRDLIPDRAGGRFIASHIHIPDAGPVPDYVHYHHIRFQLIFVRRGWVRVVYEDQGEPFVMEAGDCVLQPPRIRHRVMESSGDLEVVEIGCPAEHRTCTDPGLELPNDTIDPDRDFGGQRFVRHRADVASWSPWNRAGFEYRDSGISDATSGLASVRVIRPTGSEVDATPASHDGEFLFYFALSGTVRLDADPATDLASGDSITVPAGLEFAFTDPSDDLELLEVFLPSP